MKLGTKAAVAVGFLGVLVLGTIPVLAGDIVCSQCGPGDHWVDTCPSGSDLISKQGAVVGIDTDLDCAASPFAAVTFSIGSFQEASVPTLTKFLLLTATPALYCGSAAWLSRRIGFSPFVLGVGWLGVEFALGQAGLRTGLLGLAAGEGGALHWLGEVLGWLFVCFLFALLNAWVVVVLNGVRLNGAVQLRPVSSADYIPLLFAQTFMGYPLFSVPASQPRGPPFAAASVLG